MYDSKLWFENCLIFLLTSLWAIIYSFTAHKIGHCHWFVSCHFLFRSAPMSVQLQDQKVLVTMQYTYFQYKEIETNIFCKIRSQINIYLVFPKNTPSGLSIGNILNTISFRSSWAIPWWLVRNSIIPKSNKNFVSRINLICYFGFNIWGLIHNVKVIQYLEQQKMWQNLKGGFELSQ